MKLNALLTWPCWSRTWKQRFNLSLMHSTWCPFNTFQQQFVERSFLALGTQWPMPKRQAASVEAWLRISSDLVKWFHVPMSCAPQARDGDAVDHGSLQLKSTRKHRCKATQSCENASRALECYACRYSECTFWHWRKDSSGLGTYRSSILLSSMCFWSLYIFALFARQRVFKATPASCQPTKRGGHFGWLH